MKIILIGPPGTGKDTQARFLKNKFGFFIVSAGDIIREEIKKKSEYGKIFKKFYDKGELYSGDVLCKLILEKIKDKKNIILNGYPRTIAQAKRLKVGIDKVIYIKTSKENAIKRLMGRGRKDDVKEIIKNRIAVFERETKPLLEFYKDKLIKINGDKSPKKVFEEILEKLK